MDWKNKELFDIHGRHIVIGDTLYLSYSASYVDFYYKGSRLEAVITSDGELPNDTWDAWISVFINDEKTPIRHIRMEKGQKSYLIFDRRDEDGYYAGDTAVKIRIMKTTEAAFATVGLMYLICDGEIVPGPFRKKPALIEFIGDSITCGYGVEADNELCPFTTGEENPWEAYACRTARILGYDFELVSWSGNGIISHYIDPSVDERRIFPPLMPEIYAYTDRELETRIKSDLTRWEPERKPDYIVINLGTNDCSYTRTINERNDHFKREYINFVKEICRQNEEASIIIVYGIMDDRLNLTLKEAVRELAHRDGQIFELPLDMQLDEDGRGADYHPSKITHEKVAVKLARFIESISR